MIKSMTGFGKGESRGKAGRIIVEIRTVNQRYFDLSCRLPASFNQLEDRIKTCLHKYIRRGKVNLFILHRKVEDNFDSIKLDEAKIERYYRILNRTKRKFKLKDEIRLSNILMFPDVIIREQADSLVASMWPALERALKKAAMDCDRMRGKEGRRLYQDLTKRETMISKALDEIADFVPQLVSDYKARLDSKIEDILGQKARDIDKGRLETELALFARQSDVSEEITRARSHLIALKKTLRSDKEAGRRLDFILQELNREINTLGSKAGGVKISRLVVDIKSEMEKMREQVQNIE